MTARSTARPVIARAQHVSRAPSAVAAGKLPASRSARLHAVDPLPPPLVWTFDGPFERCLDDIEDSLRRAIVLIGDVSRVVLLVELSLPSLQARVHAGDRIQPAWGRFLDRLGGYGLPSAPRVRPLATRGPLATLVIAYRS